jgi:hypothetical protein
LYTTIFHHIDGGFQLQSAAVIVTGRNIKNFEVSATVLKPKFRIQQYQLNHQGKARNISTRVPHNTLVQVYKPSKVAKVEFVISECCFITFLRLINNLGLAKYCK